MLNKAIKYLIGRDVDQKPVFINILLSQSQQIPLTPGSHTAASSSPRVVNMDIEGNSWRPLDGHRGRLMLVLTRGTAHNILHHSAITAASVPRSTRDSAAPHLTRISVGASGGVCDWCALLVSAPLAMVSVSPALTSAHVRLTPDLPHQSLEHWLSYKYSAIWGQSSVINKLSSGQQVNSKHVVP